MAAMLQVYRLLKIRGFKKMSFAAEDNRNNQILSRPKPLANQVREILTKRIESGIYQPGSQIPPENTLAKELGVSRATIRRALDILESRGQIIRKQGIGSFISTEATIKNPINRSILFQKFIENSGFKPGVDFIKTDVITPDKKLKRLLRIDAKDKIIQLHKVFTADNEPVIYLINSIPEWVVGERIEKEIEANPEITEPIFDFLKQRCNQNLIFYKSSIYPDWMHNCPLDDPRIIPNDLAFVFDETGFNQNEVPIMHSLHYYPGDKVKFEMIRLRD